MNKQAIADLYQAAYAYDEQKITAIVDCCCELYPLKRVCLDLIVPVMDILEAEAHKRVITFASQTILVILRRKALYTHRDLPRPHAPLIISGSVPYQGDDDLYGFMLSLLLVVVGYKVVHIEGDFSLEDLLLAIDSNNISAIVLHSSKPNERSICVMHELEWYLRSKEYSCSFDKSSKFVRRPQLFLSGNHGFPIPDAISITLLDVVGTVARYFFGKQILRIKDDMVTTTNELITSSCALMRQSYKNLGALDAVIKGLGVNMYPIKL